jgi:hypothetical protein
MKVLGGMFGLFFHGEDINMMKGHNVGFVVNLKALTIHHKLIAFYIHNGYRFVGEHRMHNIRSVLLALQFPLFEGFKPQIVEEDLISSNFLSYDLLILSFYMLAFSYAFNLISSSLLIWILHFTTAASRLRFISLIAQ